MISMFEKEIINIIMNLMLRTSLFGVLYSERSFRVDSLVGRYSRLIILAISYGLGLLIALVGSFNSTIARA